MFPVRCYTCNTVLAHMHPEYMRCTKEVAPAKDTLDRLGVKRMCCRRIFLSYVDLVTENLAHGYDDIKLDAADTRLRRRTLHETSVSCD